MRLTRRQQQILAAVVDTYIRTGDPVGSKAISLSAGLNVSSATIRSEMAALYEWGYLEQPHTSAGRIPSHLGYREYIDCLMTCAPLGQEERDEIESLFNVKNPDPEKLLGDAAQALSEHTGYATVTSSIVPKTVSVRKIELIAAGANTVVILLIASNGVIRNKICRVDFTVTPEIISFFNKFVRLRFEGKSIGSITSSYIGSVSITLGEYSHMFTTILINIFELCREVGEGKYYISGGTRLLAYDEGASTARELLLLLESRERLDALFSSGGSSFKIIIGKENTGSELADSSVVMTSYEIAGKPAGTVGLIGPVRINYPRLIPHLEYFAKMLGELMSETLEGE
jgi:heat-inducible transcriptional repressor